MEVVEKAFRMFGRPDRAARITARLDIDGDSC